MWMEEAGLSELSTHFYQTTRCHITTTALYLVAVGAPN